MLVTLLTDQIKNVCPIYGASIGDVSDKNTWRIDFHPSATPAQKVEAQAVVDSFDIASSSTSDLINSLAAAVQSHLDTQAMVYGYDNIVSAVSYRGDTLNPEWAAEADAFFSWRSACWSACLSIKESVLTGATPLPTPEQLVAMLPVLNIGAVL